MNLPKFIKDDERLFRLLLGDLFPSLELPVPEYGALQVSGEVVLYSANGFSRAKPGRGQGQRNHCLRVLVYRLP